MASRICLLAGMLFLFWPSLTAQTQVAARAVTEPVAAASATSAAGGMQESPSPETVPRVPGVTNLFRGFNAGMNYAGVHNSAMGWYSVATPALSYAFSSRYSADVSSSIYFKRNYLTYAHVSGSPLKAKWVEEAADSGDTLFGFHAAFDPGQFEDIVTATLSAPTGNTAAGLGTGRVTFDVTNHVARYRKQLGLFLDVGAGDSSVLFNSSIDRNYSTLGALAHFLAGAEYWFGSRIFVEPLIYEQLPMGSQKRFAPSMGSGTQQPGTASKSTSGASEDNGVTTYLGIPLTGNLTLSSYYSRSLRRHTDTVSFGFTWVWRGRKWGSLVDRALEEAEKQNAQQ